MPSAHELPDQIPQALADQVQAVSNDPSVLRSLHFDSGYINRKDNQYVFRLEQTGEEVSARVYNLRSQNGRLIESKRATNAGLYYLVIQGGQYQEPVLVAKTPSLRVWRGIDIGLDPAGGVIREYPAAPTTIAPTVLPAENVEPLVDANVPNEPFRPASHFSGSVRPSALPAPFSPAPSVPRSDVPTVIKREHSPLDFDFGIPGPPQQEQHDKREHYVIEDTPMVMNSIEDNEPAATKQEPAIKREPSVAEIVGPANAPQAPPQQYAAAQYPAPQYPVPIFPIQPYGYDAAQIPAPIQYPAASPAAQYPAPQVFFHFLDAAGNRRRTRPHTSCADSAALFANVRAVHPYAPTASLDLVFARVAGSGQEIPLVRHDNEDWNVLMSHLEYPKGVAIVNVEIRAAV